MAAILHAVPLSGVCRKGRSSPVPQVRERPEEMRCVGSKRTRELGRDMLLAASIVKSSVAKAHGRNRTVFPTRAPRDTRTYAPHSPPRNPG
jgi:hypothetical protein